MTAGEPFFVRSTRLVEPQSVRAASLSLFEILAAAAWRSTGVTLNLTWSVEDIARATVGHARHHFQIIEKHLTVSL